MSTSPSLSTPVLEPAAKDLADATSQHPRIYEVPPENGREILDDLQAGEAVAKPAVDEQWVSVDVSGRAHAGRRSAAPSTPRLGPS